MYFTYNNNSLPGAGLCLCIQQCVSVDFPLISLITKTIYPAVEASELHKRTWFVYYPCIIRSMVSVCFLPYLQKSDNVVIKLSPNFIFYTLHWLSNENLQILRGEDLSRCEMLQLLCMWISDILSSTLFTVWCTCTVKS